MIGVVDEITVPEDFQRNRVHWYWSMVSVPATQLWVLLILVSLLILPYGFFHAYFHDGASGDGEFRSASLKLMIVAGTFFVFWGIHLYAMAMRHRFRWKWKWLEELALNPSVRLKIVKNGATSRGEISNPNWQLLFFAGEPLGLLILGLPFLLPFLMFSKSFEVFVTAQCGICVAVSLGGFFAYIQKQAEEVQLSKLGVVVAIPHDVCLCPWESIEQIVWKEPRMNSLQMELHFKPMDQVKGASREIKLEPISDEERDQVLRFLTEHVPVKRLWVREGGE